MTQLKPRTSHVLVPNKDQLPQGLIDQSTLPAGVYLIRIYGQDDRLTGILTLFKR